MELGCQKFQEPAQALVDIFESCLKIATVPRIGDIPASLKHKTMMGLLVRKAKNLPEEKKNAEVRAMIETYNQVIDFIDYESLSSIIDELK